MSSTLLGPNIVSLDGTEKIIIDNSDSASLSISSTASNYVTTATLSAYVQKNNPSLALITDGTPDFVTALGQGAGAFTPGTASVSVAFGYHALAAQTTGTGNSGVGYQSLAALTTATNNTGVGYETLFALTTASNNTAIGYAAGKNISSATGNTFIGSQAGGNAVMTGGGNVGIGYLALQFLSSGTHNVAIGQEAMGDAAGLTGSHNIAIGYATLGAVSTSSYNIAIGEQALDAITTTTVFSIAIGFQSLKAVTTGLHNIGIGHSTGIKLTTGAENIAIGYQALNNSAVAQTTIAIGSNVLSSYADADTTYNCNSVAIGFNNLTLFTGAVGLAENVAIGNAVMPVMTTGAQNVGVGIQALQSATTPIGFNVAIGTSALGGLTTGAYNTALGHAAGYTIGSGAGSQTNAVTTATNCTFIGWQCGPSSVTARNFQTVIGAQATGYDAANTITIGQIGTDTIYTGPAVIGISSVVGGIYTIGTLPSATAALAGARAFVSNGLVATGFGNALAGTGSAVLPVFCTGAGGWIYG